MWSIPYLLEVLDQARRNMRYQGVVLLLFITFTVGMNDGNLYSFDQSVSEVDMPRLLSQIEISNPCNNNSHVIGRWKHIHDIEHKHKSFHCCGWVRALFFYDLIKTINLNVLNLG